MRVCNLSTFLPSNANIRANSLADSLLSEAHVHNAEQETRAGLEICTESDFVVVHVQSVAPSENVDQLFEQKKSDDLV